MTTTQLGHGHFDDQGKHHGTGHGSDEYQHGVNSMPGQAYAAFGHFGAMIHNAPIHRMRGHSQVVTHVSCGSRIEHDGRSVGFTCRGCGRQVVSASELA